MVRIVQHFLLGSILSKLLLVLGSAFFTRGTLDNRRAQVFAEVGDCYSDLISRVAFLNENDTLKSFAFTVAFLNQ